MLIAQKRKYVHKTLWEKCQALKDLEKGLSNKDVAAKYGVPNSTLSNIKRQKLRPGDHETSDTAVFKWFLSLRSQNVPLPGATIQEKASHYAKELSIENFKASGESNSVTPKMVNAWSETSLPTLYCTTMI